MLGGMQDHELRLSSLIDHAAREHAGQEIVSIWADGHESRTNWAAIRYDAMRMRQALARLGVAPGGRVATLAMNHSRHLVTWFGATGAGCVLHTINPRLFDDQLTFIVTHAEDRVLLYDAVFAPIVERLRADWPCVEHFICFDAALGDPAFEDWIGEEDGQGAWLCGSERDPAMLCYTSGTTGNPKGVLYEHRSTVLHAYASLMPPALDLGAQSVILPVVPMFHACNWGIPWSAAAVGAKLVYSATNDPAALLALVRREKVNYIAGVPTIWLSLFQYCDASGEEFPPISNALSGGSALPKALIERLLRLNIRVAHAWGMTETSPIATISYESSDWDELPLERKVAIKAMQGKAIYGIELRTVDMDDPRRELPRDGVTSGALQVRGAWVVKRYFKAEADAVGEDQWFDTGDVAILHPDGTVQLTDRTKDVIKSGGEWISSVDLENAAIGHPAVAEAAAIGIAHPKWDERPLLVVVKRPGLEVTAEELRDLLAVSVAKWWLPDAVEFVDSLPHTGTGKISKKDLREQFKDYAFP